MVRLYPHHNDVGVWRVWEARACLANYLIQHPDAVLGRSVIPFGSGVGLTGLVVAVLCCTSRVSRYLQVIYANMQLSNPI